MENASKALLIAAGVLISVLLFSMFLYMKDEIGLFQTSKVDAKLIEENNEFNSKYEAYNKTFMYGTDVISVVSMAYDNNLKYYNDYGSSREQTDAQMYYINVSIDIKEKLEGKLVGYQYDPEKNEFINDDSIINSFNLRDNTVVEANEGSSTYELNLFKNDSWTYSDMMNDNKLLDLISTSNGPTKINQGNNAYILKYSWKTEFKQRAFFCESVEYNSSTGRIKSMSFVEQSLN